MSSVPSVTSQLTRYITTSDVTQEINYRGLIQLRASRVFVVSHFFTSIAFIFNCIFVAGLSFVSIAYLNTRDKIKS